MATNHLAKLLFIFFLTSCSLAALLPFSSSTATPTALPNPDRLSDHFPELLPPQDIDHDDEKDVSPGEQEEGVHILPILAPRQQPQQQHPAATLPPAVAGGAPIPAATEAPPAKHLEDAGFRQETYYECKTRDGKESCGWHMPLVEVGGGERVKGRMGWVVLAVGGVTGMFVAGLL